VTYILLVLVSSTHTGPAEGAEHMKLVL